MQARRLEGPVKVNHQVIPGRRLRRPAVEVHHDLVVPVHKIYLEAFYAHSCIFAACALHVLLEGPVTSPENQAHALVLRIPAQHGKVYFRHHLEKVGLLVHGPALVQNHILEARRGGKVNIILVGPVVDAGLEVHAVKVPGVPPVPGHFSGFHPAEVLFRGRRLSQEPGKVAGKKVFVFLCHNHNAPGKGLVAAGFGNVVLAGVHNALQEVMPALHHLLGVRRKNGFEGVVLVLVPKVHPGIVYQAALGDAHFHALGRLKGNGEEGDTAALPLANLRMRIKCLAGSKELAFKAILRLAGIRDKAFIVPAKAKLDLFVHHHERGVTGRHKAVRGTVVVGTELYGVAVAAERELVVGLRHFFLKIDLRFDYPVHAAPHGLFHFYIPAKRTPVVQDHGQGRWFQHPYALPGDAPLQGLPCGDLHLEVPGGRLQFIAFRRRLEAKAQHCRGDGRQEEMTHRHR